MIDPWTDAEAALEKAKEYERMWRLNKGTEEGRKYLALALDYLTRSVELNCGSVHSASKDVIADMSRSVFRPDSEK